MRGGWRDEPRGGGGGGGWREKEDSGSWRRGGEKEEKEEEGWKAGNAEDWVGAVSSFFSFFVS